MRSHSVYLPPAEMRILSLPPAKSGTQFSDLGWMQSWIDLCYVKADRLGFEPATCQSQVQRSTAAPPRNTTIVLTNQPHSDVEKSLTLLGWFRLLVIQTCFQLSSGRSRWSSVLQIESWWKRAHWGKICISRAKPTRIRIWKRHEI